LDNPASDLIVDYLPSIAHLCRCTVTLLKSIDPLQGQIAKSGVHCPLNVVIERPKGHVACVLARDQDPVRRNQKVEIVEKYAKINE